MCNKWFIAVLSLVGLTAVAGLGCSEDFVQRHGSVFAVPGSCEEYLECVDGLLTRSSCPLGSLFDVELNECSSDPQAKCSEETVADVLCGDLDEAVAFPNLYSCARYALCLGEFSIARQCDHGLLFNSLTRVCESAQNAVCDVTCPVEGDKVVYLPDSSGQNCARYYICFNGTPQPAECPSMQYFDLVTESCTTPADASCRVRGVTCSDVDGLIAHPEDCTSYYNCEGGFPHVMECDAEQHFYDGQCVPGDCDDLVTDEPEVTTEVGTAEPSTAPTPTDSPSTITIEISSITPEITTELPTASPSTTDSPSTITTESPSTSITTESPSVTPEITTQTADTTPTDSPSTITTEMPPTTAEITTELSTVTTPEITTELSTADPTPTNSPSTITTELPSITPDITTELSTASPSTTPTDSPSIVTTESPSPTPEITTASTATIEPSTVTAQSSTVESSTTTDSPSTDPTVVCQGVDIGIFAHPFNCYQYFVCIFDVGRLFSCSVGQIFDPLLICVAGDRDTCVPTRPTL